MRIYDFVTLDVFTGRKFAGNQLAVVKNADDLTSDEMQTIAREFNLSETVFVLRPARPQSAAKIRIFTPGYEMPFAGHPTVGAAIAIASKRNLADAMELELNTGVFAIGLDTRDGVSYAEFLNPNLPAIAGGAPAAGALARALSLPAGSINEGAHRPRLIGAGVNFVFATASLDAVRAAKVNSGAFDDLGLENTVGVLLYAKGGDHPGADFHVRMFAPGAGIVEDPATGSAAAALPGQIAATGDLPDGVSAWKIEQGFEMGRASLINVTVEALGGAVRSVRVGGCAVAVMRGQLSV
ncbi:MAG: PhzF family phenazine biosynthesis protein [Parvularculaceae bacterium]